MEEIDIMMNNLKEELIKLMQDQVLEQEDEFDFDESAKMQQKCLEFTKEWQLTNATVTDTEPVKKIGKEEERKKMLLKIAASSEADHTERICSMS